MRKYSLWYEFMKAVVNWPMLQGFYRSRKVVGYEQVPRDTPVLLAVNHQNALIDALLVVGSTDYTRQTSFLTRSDVFNKNTNRILHSFKMLPIYRQRDGGAEALRKNDEIFDICVERLQNREVVLIFPEGNHNRQRRLRPLKKGIARIAFRALEASDFNLDLKIVPVGIHYVDHLKFDNKVMVVFGPAMDLKDYIPSYKENPNKTLTVVTKEVRKRLSDHMIHILNPQHYDFVEGIWRLFTPAMMAQQGKNTRDLYQQLIEGKKLVSKVEAYAVQGGDALPGLKSELASYEDGLKKLKLRSHVLDEAPHSFAKQLFQFLALLIGFIPYLYGLVLNYLPYKLSERITKRLFKDDHFYASIMGLSGYVLFPVWYLILSLVFGWVMGSFLYALVFLASLPLSGKFAAFFARKFKKWWGRGRYNRLKRKKNTLLTQTEQSRKNLLEWLDRLLSAEGNQSAISESVEKV